MGGTQLRKEMECGTFNISEGRKELELRLRHEWTMPEQKSWRFSYEALTHVHSLRLFLFNSLISVPFKCKSLRASLVPTAPFSSSPLVVCRWEMPEGSDSYIVYVPIPFCLIDHSAPFAVVARSDHIEVKIKLLPFGGTLADDLSFLGFTHKEVVPTEMDGVGKSKPHKCDKSSFSLTSDTEMLTKKHVVSFFCRNCSAKLTSQLIRLYLQRIGVSLQVTGLELVAAVMLLKPSHRYHSLERVFSSQLLSSTEDNSSYRYIIHGLINRLPLLQLVIINHESWNCSGTCLGQENSLANLGGTESLFRHQVSILLGNETDSKNVVSCQACESVIVNGNGELFPPIFLEPVMKVMFRDTSSFNSQQFRDVEKWAQKQHPDDIYMLDSEVKSLAKSLQANTKLLPESCASFEQFHFSFLAR